MMVGAEAEHFLVRRREDGSIVPFDPDGVDTMEKPCYDFKSLAGSMGYLRTLLTYLDQLGWEPYASDHEDGTAQFEINWKYSDALTTADRLTFFKMMTSQVAKGIGAIATHMPKPFAHLTGSGTHFHISLWDTAKQRNRFLDAKDRRGLGLSPLAYHFLGGVVDARPRPDRRRRAHGERLQAPLGRRVPDGRHLRVHLDPGVHQLRRQQPDPDVPRARARAIRVPPGLRLGEPVPRHGRLHRRGPRRHPPPARPGGAERREEHVCSSPRTR